MRKSITCLAAAACLMTVMMSGTAFADWQSLSDGRWIYTEGSNNMRVTSDWRKGADDQFRWLDASGVMATNTWADGEYYVDENGIRVTNQWKKLENRNASWDAEDKTAWFYFSSTGKCFSDGWCKIDGKQYYFDSNGALKTGWIDDDHYALEDGTMAVGWHECEDPDYEDERDNDPFDEEEKSHYYYFLSTGKVYKPNISTGNAKTYKIDGKTYCFDERGAMLTGWVDMDDKEGGGFDNYRYCNQDGTVATGWLSLYPPDDNDPRGIGYTDEVQWFYFNSQGVPKVGKPLSEAVTSGITKINNISYMFDEKGNPVYGLRKVMQGEKEYCYYFGEDRSVSSVVKGKAEVLEGDGTKSSFYFTETGSSAGRGYTGVKNNYLYYMGKLQKAEEKYEVINVEEKAYLVNTAGKVMKNAKKVKDMSGDKISTGSLGTVNKINDESDNGLGIAREPLEPTYWDID